MSLIMEPLITPWSQLEGREIRQEAEKARTKGDTKTAEILEKLDQIGEMAETGAALSNSLFKK